MESQNSAFTDTLREIEELMAEAKKPRFFQNAATATSGTSPIGAATNRARARLFRTPELSHAICDAYDGHPWPIS